jgi:hypothetical protein
MLIPKPHQIKFSEKLFNILSEKGYAYLAGKPRSGKTYTAILTAEKSTLINSVLVLTKKAAISGWLKFINGNTILRHTYHVTNYEQMGTINNGKISLKLNPNNYDFVIVDESHNFGTLGKPSNRIKLLQHICRDKPHLHLSGTAIVESPNGIYHQMAISKYTPFEHKNFYTFFKEFGIPYFIKVMGIDRRQYNKANLDLLMPKINEFTLYMEQSDAGISRDVQAIDEVHLIELPTYIKDVYNELQKNQLIYLGDKVIVADSVMKMRITLHMIENGVIKIDDNNCLYLGKHPKIDYILDKFGDNEKVGIMSHFICEQKLLKKYFHKAEIYSSNAHAEGVDLSHLEHFIILSSDYSGAKFIQRRERIINTEGSNTNKVHHLLVKNAISYQVYQKVSKKLDFNNSTYEANFL